MLTDFPHLHSAHCETGTYSGLLRQKGIDISEPMIFGIGSGLYFAYMPYYRYNSVPFFAFRIFPGHLLNNFNRRLNIKMQRMKFRDADEAMDEMDRMLELEVPVGVITNLFFIPYFPEENRFHFNNHNLIVYGREGEQYLVSDPMLEEKQKISRDDLARARFSHGLRDLKGNSYHIAEVPGSFDLRMVIRQGIRATAKNMLTMMPLNGVRGIHHVAERVKKWPSKHGEKMARRYLISLVRMLEEVGTGGSGFRYMYAAFLQESSDVLKQERLMEASDHMTLAGNSWREFSYLAATICKTDRPPFDMYVTASEALQRCSALEEKVFRSLLKIA